MHTSAPALLSRSQIIAMLSVLAVFRVPVGADELEGTWIGEDATGETVTLVFGPDHRFQLLLANGKDAFDPTDSSIAVSKNDLMTLTPEQLRAKYSIDELRAAQRLLARGATLPTHPLPDRVEYYPEEQVYPKKLYLKFLRRDEVLVKAPFAVYKLAHSRLVLCLASSYQTTLGGIALGTPRYEFPKDFSGECFSCGKQTWLDRTFNSLFGDD